MGVTALLARHGSHDELGRVLSGRSEIGLNRAGRIEAARLARRVAATPLAAIHTSPRRRARETAAIVAGARALAAEPVDALDEIDFAGWSGRSFAELDGDPAWTAWNARRGSARVPGGESMAEVVGRARAHLETLPAGHAVLCVSHGDVIRGLVCHYLGLEYGRMLDFDCDPGSLTTLVIEDGRGRLVALNERAA